MSVEIIKGEYYQVLICNTTMIAFGDVFYYYDDVEHFLDWLPEDARTYEHEELSKKIGEWRNTLPITVQRPIKQKI